MINNQAKIRILTTALTLPLACLALSGEANAKILPEGVVAADLDEVDDLAIAQGVPGGKSYKRRIAPEAHMSSYTVYYGEEPDRVVGVQFWYQNEYRGEAFKTKRIGKKSKIARSYSVGWYPIITGITTSTSDAGYLTSFKVITNVKNVGATSTETTDEVTREFGSNLLFAGFTARADKEGVYGLGLLTVPAASVPARKAYNAVVVDAVRDRKLVMNRANRLVPVGVPSRALLNAPKPPIDPTKWQKKAPQPATTGLAGTLNAIGKILSEGRGDLESQARERQLLEEQAARNRARAANRAPRTASSGGRSNTGIANTANQPRLGGNNKVILYDDCNYQGKAVGLDVRRTLNGELFYYDTDTLRRVGMENDRVSSIKILPGYEIVASSNNYARGGLTKTFRSNVSCLVDYNFNDVLSHAVVRPASRRGGYGKPPSSETPARPSRAPTRVEPSTPVSSLRLGGNNKVILYEDCNYQGKAIGIYEGGWNIEALTRFGMPNDKVSSIKVLSGYQIDAYSNDKGPGLGGGGVKKTFTSNVACLTDHNFNDVLSYADVGIRKSLAFGENPQAGQKRRSTEELSWTTQNVTGLNVGAIYYENARFDGWGKPTSGRFEISEEGSNKWKWFENGHRDARRPRDRSGFRSDMTIARRGTDFVTFHVFNDNVLTDKVPVVLVVNLKQKTIQGTERTSPTYSFRAQTTTVSRPE